MIRYKIAYYSSLDGSFDNNSIIRSLGFRDRADSDVTDINKIEKQIDKKSDATNIIDKNLKTEYIFY